MKTRLMLAALCTTIIGLNAHAKTLNVPGGPADQKLAIEVIKEVVARSDRYDSYTHIYAETGEPASTKVLADLQQGDLDIVWFGTTSRYEQDMEAVYFPIYRGLLGMRIAIINRDDANQFAGINTFSQFKSFIPCQGKTWSDTFILEANGLKVAKSLKYPNLFPMLDAERCDYFPRGVFEPFSEVQNYTQYDFMVDEHVMLRYRMPYYLFVRKGNTDLANHLTSIIEDMFEDGTYNELFFADPEVSTSLPLANLAERTVLDLDNPDLSPRSRAIDSSIWFDPLKGKQ
ncbi:transporter substrate-binding domain-containing protein [Vibrio ulleungensis]|uniref:Transporter substrate-binding domain-containing protein n=1 Tax=Vibrio ulleungensis TaxID=2807619 RepID=A0ABS2HKT8_9VIBR|nr:transporter substrate-binding domain-containing protein [Vibrio ulleungensis]MBM7036421.1 transporter substrate-binding domain-containing protein [Vibrio ulleungensis]